MATYAICHTCGYTNGHSTICPNLHNECIRPCEYDCPRHADDQNPKG